MRKVFEGNIPEPTRSCADAGWTEDGGMALVAVVPYDCERCAKDDCLGCEKNRNGMFIQVHSWDERKIPQAKRHEEMRQLFGKKIRVTVEVID